MHPLALTSYPRRVTLTQTRSSRRRARRAAIAVVVGLLGAGAGQAYADPQPQSHGHLPGSHANVHQHSDWATVQTPPALSNRHEALGRIHATTTGGRTMPVNAPAGNGSDAWPVAIVAAMLAALFGAVALSRRHRLPSTT